MISNLMTHTILPCLRNDQEQLYECHVDRLSFGKHSNPSQNGSIKMQQKLSVSLVFRNKVIKRKSAELIFVIKCANQRFLPMLSIHMMPQKCYYY